MEWRLSCNEPVPADTILGAYTGEVVSSLKTERRNQRYYFTSANDVTIDARKRGSLQRFLNHRCDEVNVEADVELEGDFPHIIFKTTARVEEGNF
jgi:hypothetical protein